MISAIILAAGESRRMGKQKLLLPYGGKTVIEHIVDEVIGSNVDEYIVVTGHDENGVRDALGARAVAFAHNTNYRGGMLTSVRRGLKNISANAEAFLVVLGDQPSISRGIINFVLEGYRSSNRGIVVPLHDDDTGHPIMISSQYRNEIMTQFDDTGLRGLIYGRPDEVYKLPVPFGSVLRDMDTPEDYQRELKALEREANIKI